MLLSKEEIKANFDYIIDYSEGAPKQYRNKDEISNIAASLFWSNKHSQISTFFSQTIYEACDPENSFQMFDSRRDLLFAYLPKFSEASEIFSPTPAVVTRAFAAVRRMTITARFHVVHSGLSVMKNNCLYSHLESDIPMLRALSPLAIKIQQTISKCWPELYKMLKRNILWGIGGSIFQTVARNFDTTVLHRDPLDKTIAWLYYEGSWENSSFLLPELKISAKLGKGTLIGVWGRYLFHGSSKNSGQGTCYVFYNNFLKSTSPPTLTKLTKLINEEIMWTW